MIVKKVQEDVVEDGFGASTPTLTQDLSPDIFRKHYYHKETLVKFCREHNIPLQGLKNELSDRVEYFLRTGEVPAIKFSNKVNTPPDSQLGLSLDKRVVHYKSDPVTRVFFEKHIPKFIGFSAYVQKWLKQRLANGEFFTYKDVIEEHKRFLEEKTKDKSSGTLRQVAHDSCQYNQFFMDYAHDVAEKPHSAKEAWKLVRDSAGDKTYARYKNVCCRQV